MEMEAATEAAASWRERFLALQRDFSLLQEDAGALARAFEGAAADLALQQESQAVMVEKLAEIRLRRFHEFLRVPESAKMLFLERMKPMVRDQHPLMPRRQLRAVLNEQWEALGKDELETWEARFQAYMKTHQTEEPPAKKKRTKAAATPKATAASKRKAAAGDSKPATPKKRKVVNSASSPSTPSQKRVKSEDQGEPVDSDTSAPATPSKAAKNVRSKASPKKKATPSMGVASPAKSSPLAQKKEVSAKKVSAPKKKKPSKAATKKTTKALDDDSDSVHFGTPADQNDTSDDDINDDDDDDDNDDEDENESLSGGSPSDDDSDDNMAQLPTGAFG